MLSMTRIGLAPVLGYLIIEEDFNVALGVFALAGLTDLVSYKVISSVLLPFHIPGSLRHGNSTALVCFFLEGNPQDEFHLALYLRACL